MKGKSVRCRERVSSLESERQSLEQALDTSLEEEYRFVNAQLTELRAQVTALEIRRDALRTELEAAGVNVAPLETGGQSGGAVMLGQLEEALSGGELQPLEPSGGITGGLLETGGTVGTGGAN